MYPPISMFGPNMVKLGCMATKKLTKSHKPYVNVTNSVDHENEVNA